MATHNAIPSLTEAKPYPVWLDARVTVAPAARLADDVKCDLAIMGADLSVLAAAVMSRDTQRCERVARQFRAGVIWINCSQPTFVEAPWGGYKRSGIGRGLGEWGYNSYLEIKQITQYNGGSWGWYSS